MACCRTVLLAALALVTTTANAQVLEPGICPFSTPLADWDEEQFVSEPWFEMQALAFPGLHDAAAKPHCTRWHFTPSEDGLGLHARLAYRANDGEGVARAFAQYTTSEKHPRFNLTFHDLGGLGVSRSVDMKLVATDYRDFALLWGCSEPNLFDRKVVTWVLSRQPSLSDNAREALRSLFRRHDIRAERLVDTDHGICRDALASDAASASFGRARGEADDAFAAYSRDLPAFKTPAYRSLSQTETAGSEDGDADALPRLSRPEDGVTTEDVSWSYLGSDWTLGEGTQVGLLVGLAAVSLLASLLTFRALTRRLQRPAKPVLPVHRQDVVVATLGSSVDYSRFGGLGQGLSRKHVSDPTPTA